MVEDPLGPYAPIVSVRRGRNSLPDEDRAMLEERRKRQQNHDDDQGQGEGGGGHGEGHGHDCFHDDVSVLGIPEEQMTEPVRHAIGLLLDEINDLRAELVRAKGHEAYLEQQAEKDRVLHVMRRRAFLARLNLVVRRVEDEKVLFCFLYVVITNAQSVRQDFGHGAAEGLQIQTSDLMHDVLETGDVVGSLENFDFGIILPATTPIDADQKGRDLINALSARSFVWQGQTLGIQAEFGVAEIAPGDSAEDIIDRARRALDAHRAAMSGTSP